MIIIHFRKTGVAHAPDELCKLQNAHKSNNDEYYIVRKNVKELDKLIDKHNGKQIVIHFHNRVIDDPKYNTTNIKSIIQYHSEPMNDRVDLNPKYCVKKLVLNQYHCTLPGYAGCIPVRNVFVGNGKIVFANKIKIGYYPSSTWRITDHADKGYERTVPILNNIKKKYGDKVIIDVNTGMSYNNYIERKKDCHIVIDECVTGSFHKSTIESLVQGTVVFVWINKTLANKQIRLYGRVPPVINTTIPNLEANLCKMIDKGKDVIEKEAIANSNTFQKYWNPDIVYKEFNKVYKSCFI